MRANISPYFATRRRKKHNARPRANSRLCIYTSADARRPPEMEGRDGARFRLRVFLRRSWIRGRHQAWITRRERPWRNPEKETTPSDAHRWTGARSRTVYFWRIFPFPLHFLRVLASLSFFFLLSFCRAILFFFDNYEKGRKLNNISQVGTRLFLTKWGHSAIGKADV